MDGGDEDGTDGDIDDKNENERDNHVADGGGVTSHLY